MPSFCPGLNPSPASLCLHSHTLPAPSAMAAAALPSPPHPPAFCVAVPYSRNTPSPAPGWVPLLFASSQRELQRETKSPPCIYFQSVITTFLVIADINRKYLSSRLSSLWLVIHVLLFMYLNWCPVKNCCQITFQRRQEELVKHPDLKFRCLHLVRVPRLSKEKVNHTSSPDFFLNKYSRLAIMQIPLLGTPKDHRLF